MSKTTFRPLLALLLLVFLTPGLAPAASLNLERAKPVYEVQEQGIVSLLYDRLADLFWHWGNEGAQAVKNGGQLEPNGGKNDNGGQLDPNGGPAPAPTSSGSGG